MRARGRVEAVSSGRTCWFALRRPVPLSDVVLTKLWGARGADCLLRIVGGHQLWSCCLVIFLNVGGGSCRG
jgi:hypothetical protein